MNATMFSLFHSIKFSQFCALSDGGHSTIVIRNVTCEIIYTCTKRELTVV